MGLELEDIQGLITTGHSHLNYSIFLLLRVVEKQAAKGWLKSLITQITTARHRSKAEGKPRRALHVLFSIGGLQALGLPAESLGTFPIEFQEGLAEARRSRVLGDTGDSDPLKWTWGGSRDSEAHLVLMLYAQDDAELLALCREQRDAIQRDGGLREIASEEAVVPPDRKEPFGFRDGIAQPAVEGISYKSSTDDNSDDEPIKAGEFVLGYLNEYGILPNSPTVPSELNSAHLLPPVRDDSAEADFGKNGSYLVLRKLSQDVPGFYAYLKQQALNLYGTATEAQITRLGAKCVGRWPSGAPLVLAPAADDPKLGADPRRSDRFKFAETDPQGFACPLGAHIRRANPRDTITSNTKESMQVARRHRVIRRGRPYKTSSSDGTSGAEQGILFIAINASLNRQFEFIQQTWMNNLKFGGLYNDNDAIVGDNDGTCTFTMPGHPVREQLKDLPRFVQVRAGGYFFMPGIRALRFLAALP